MAFWLSVFWRPGVPRPTNHTCFGIAAKGGKAKQPLVSGKCVIFGLGTRGLQKTLGQITTSGSPTNSPRPICNPTLAPGRARGRVWAFLGPKPDRKPRPSLGVLWMWLQLMWLQFKVVRGPVGVVWGRFLTPSRFQIDPQRPRPHLGQPQLVATRLAASSIDRRSGERQPPQTS
jgi:hypothetical protein